ncbi:MAG: diguanylate cyclase [bacterium]|nr:diguanylate cyclase [bacterium]
MDRDKIKKIFSYALLIFFILTFITLIIKEVPFAHDAVQNFEKRSLDTRERILANIFNKNTEDNSRVALIVIDDDSLENLSKQYGYWPWNRKAYADIINYLEKDGANKIFLDFMFLGFQQGNEAKDWEFINEVKKYDNIYVSLNFDYREGEEKPDLPLKWSANLDNKSNDINFEDFTFTNVRGAMPELLAATKNVAFVNFQRDNDGISRRAPSFFVYREKYYPYAALKLAQDYLYDKGEIKSQKFVITNDNYIVMDTKKVKLDKEGYLIINWHNKSDVAEVPFWKVMKGEVEKGYFKDKIVAIGASAVSLSDTKNTPLDKYLPGVKFHTAYINNILNDNAIVPVDFKYNFLLIFIFVLLTSILIFNVHSNLINALSVAGLILGYGLISLILLGAFNLWIDFAYPVFLILATYTIVYVVKFIKKSQDFEKTYKLATTDGLTELYNHRYFQEQMLAQVDTSKRYNLNFSLILIDIDFFKKFNDKFGHQVGDDVLRKIAGILKKSVRASDIVARYGGEEMAIILPNTGLEDAITTANKICHAVAENPFKLMGGIECRVTISLGVATYPIHGKVPQDLIEASDKGLYDAKENGRNQVGKVQPPLENVEEEKSEEE